MQTMETLRRRWKKEPVNIERDRITVIDEAGHRGILSVHACPRDHAGCAAVASPLRQPADQDAHANETARPHVVLPAAAWRQLELMTPPSGAEYW